MCKSCSLLKTTQYIKSLRNQYVLVVAIICINCVYYFIILNIMLHTITETELLPHFLSYENHCLDGVVNTFLCLVQCWSSHCTGYLHGTLRLHCHRVWPDNYLPLQVMCRNYKLQNSFNTLFCYSLCLQKYPHLQYSGCSPV